MISWCHSGFGVYCGEPIRPRNEEGLENLVRCIIRASFFRERMFYVTVQDSPDGQDKVVYESNNMTASRAMGNQRPRAAQDA